MLVHQKAKHVRSLFHSANAYWVLSTCQALERLNTTKSLSSWSLPPAGGGRGWKSKPNCNVSGDEKGSEGKRNRVRGTGRDGGCGQGSLSVRWQVTKGENEPCVHSEAERESGGSSTYKGPGAGAASVRSRNRQTASGAAVST